MQRFQTEQLKALIEELVERYEHLAYDRELADLTEQTTLEEQLATHLGEESGLRAAEEIHLA